MQSLTAIALAASILTNVNSFKDDPVLYQRNLYSNINRNIAILLTPKVENQSDELAYSDDFVGQVLGEEFEERDPSVQVDEEESVEQVAITVTPTLEPEEEITPTPTEVLSPTPTIPQFDNFDQVGAVERAANQYGVDMNLMKSIATCETGFNAYARNTGPNHDYAGLFQFSVGTWISTRNRMGLDPDPQLRFSAEESAKTAAFKIKNDGAGAWSGCL